MHFSAIENNGFKNLNKGDNLLFKVSKGKKASI